MHRKDRNVNVVKIEATEEILSEVPMDLDEYNELVNPTPEDPNNKTKKITASGINFSINIKKS